MQIGLRIDVDTFRGTRAGVPELCRLLAQHDILATFFFSVGPDNMGRHLWRLLRPAFLKKMLRSNAAGLYGWDIVLRGTFWPGPLIGRKLGQVIRAAAQAGHEIGFHAWDHHAWQARVAALDTAAIRSEIARGVELLAESAGAPPTCSAAPGWRCTDAALLAKEFFPFAFNSDCRGHSVFRPVVDGATLAQPQVPTTLPTFDEIIGRDGITDATYNDHLLARLRPERLNVLTIHAEAEGIVCRGLFQDFLARAQALGIGFVPLGKIMSGPASIPTGRIVPGTVPGREGWVAVQAELADRRG